VPEARAGYARLEALVRREFPDAPLAFAYTSDKVRRALRRDGDQGLNVAQALSGLYDQGVTHALVQSLHASPGLEFHWARQQALAFRHPRKGFAEVAVGDPLLAAPADLEAVAAALPSYLPEGIGPDEAVVLVGHGTYHPAQTSYLALQGILAQPFPGVRVATLMGRPGIEETLAALQHMGRRAVHLLPFMFAAGHHVRHDLAGEAPDSWKNILTAAGYGCTCHLTGLGDHPPFRSIWLAHLRRAMRTLAGDEHHTST
jgi:sirohydrochlorin cobaltochelatase